VIRSCNWHTPSGFTTHEAAGQMAALLSRFTRTCIVDRYSTVSNYIILHALPQAELYLDLGTSNLERGQVAQVAATTLLKGTETNCFDLRGLTEARSKIFDDGGATVYYRRTT
jgi:hypothetical protein